LDVRGQAQREAAVIAEPVEDAAVRIPRRRLAVFPLVEEEPGLLPLAQVHVILHGALAHEHGLRHLAVQHGHVAVQPLEVSNLGIVPGENPGRRCQLDEQPGDVRQQSVRPLRQRLHNEVITIAIHDERWQEVRLAVHEAIGGGIQREGGAEGDGLLQSRPDQRLARHGLADGQHAQRDLRSVAEEGGANRAVARADDLHDVAGAGRDTHDVGTIDPGMTAANTLLAARGHDDARKGHVIR
jgi:hypothetical protein